MNVNAAFRGEYTLTRRNAETLEVIEDSGVIPNLITDGYLERAGTGGTFATVCCVGTSSTAPANTDSQLGALLASTGTVLSATTLAPTAPDWTPGRSITYRFARGVAAGNLTEVGIGWTETDLSSRALIVDSEGDPITFTVLSDEVLDITYTIYCHFSLEATSYAVTIAGVERTITAKLIQASTSSVWNGSLSILPRAVGLSTDVTALGAVTASSLGTNIYLSTSGIVPDDYVAGSHKNSGLLSLGESVANSVNGISGAVISTDAGTSAHVNVTTQMMIDPPLMKDNTKIATLKFSITWGRYTP